MRRILVTLAILAISLPSIPTVHAATFDPDFVISDAEATDVGSLDESGIQRFFELRGSGLATFHAVDVDGVGRSAAAIVYRAANDHGMSPRLLLALLQREQSLLTDAFPGQNQLDWATGYGICDGCSTDDPAVAKYRGFAVQVDDAAANFRYLMDNAPIPYLRQRDVPTMVDGTMVTPRTWATANLYNYTPHLHAQENFWNIWQQYFARHYPNGTLLTASGVDGTWLIRFGRRQLIATRAVLRSRFDPSKVVAASANDLLAYEVGPDIRFPNYSLVRSPRGTIFLLVDNERRGFTSMDVFRKLGFSLDEVDDVDWDDVNAYAEGAPITLASAYPYGQLMKVPGKPGVYFVQNGVKHPLFGPELLSLYFKNRKILSVTNDDLAQWKDGDPITLRDGELVRVKSDPTVYVISNGERLPIASGEAFESEGWQWKNVVTVSPSVLNLHPVGPVFNPNTAPESLLTTR